MTTVKLLHPRFSTLVCGFTEYHVHVAPFYKQFYDVPRSILRQNNS